MTFLSPGEINFYSNQNEKRRERKREREKKNHLFFSLYKNHFDRTTEGGRYYKIDIIYTNTHIHTSIHKGTNWPTDRTPTL